MLVSSVQQSKSVIHICISTLLYIFSHMCVLVICCVCSSVYMSIPGFSLYLPATYPVVTINVFSTSVTLFHLVDKLGHLLMSSLSFLNLQRIDTVVMCVFYVCMCLGYNRYKSIFLKIRKKCKQRISYEEQKTHGMVATHGLTIHDSMHREFT